MTVDEIHSFDGGPDTAMGIPEQRMRRPFDRISLSRQFLLGSALLLLITIAGLGGWLSRQIEENAINRASSITAVYVESILVPYLRGWRSPEPLHADLHKALDETFVLGPLRRKVVNFKLWDGEGGVLYSSDPGETGLRFPVEGMLGRAYRGEVQTQLHKTREGRRLLEVYVPIRDAAGDRVIAVAEFSHSTEKLGREIRSAQHRSWLLVVLGAITIYLLLNSLVRRANTTILEQQRALGSKLSQLRVALAENRRMQTRLSDAGARTTALNEELLHRIAADLHDGPAQELAFCLMRFDEIVSGCECLQRGEAVALRDALRAALDDMRGIASGLVLPGIADLSLTETAHRAVSEGTRLSNETVAVDIDPALGDAPLAVKITLFRLIQESLANSWRHAPHGAPHLRVCSTGGDLDIIVSDRGGGFDMEAASASGRLGLAIMRERVRLLGGTFEVNSAPGKGTYIRARIPLMPQPDDHG